MELELSEFSGAQSHTSTSQFESSSDSLKEPYIREDIKDQTKHQNEAVPKKTGKHFPSTSTFVKLDDEQCKNRHLEQSNSSPSPAREKTAIRSLLEPWAEMNPPNGNRALQLLKTFAIQYISLLTNIDFEMRIGNTVAAKGFVTCGLRKLGDCEPLCFSETEKLRLSKEVERLKVTLKVIEAYEKERELMITADKTTTNVNEGNGGGLAILSSTSINQTEKSNGIYNGEKAKVEQHKNMTTSSNGFKGKSFEDANLDSNESESDSSSSGMAESEEPDKEDKVFLEVHAGINKALVNDMHDKVVNSNMKAFKECHRQRIRSILVGNLSTWESIIGFKDIQNEIIDTLIFPRKHSHFKGTNLLRNTLFFGPPGTGKTMFAEAISVELGYSYFPVSIADVADKWYGNSVKRLSAAFMVAIDMAPCVLFFDEMESLFPERTTSRNEASNSQVAQFLLETNTLNAHNAANPEKEVLLLAATNLPMTIDSAVWRRMKKFIHVPLPTPPERKLFLTTKLGKFICDVLTPQDWETVLLYTHGFTAADLVTLVDEICKVPYRKSRTAKFFKKLEGLATSQLPRVEVTSKSTKENVLVLTKNEAKRRKCRQRHQNRKRIRSVQSFWTPCIGNELNAVMMTLEDVPDNSLFLPAITSFDIIRCTRAQRPTLNVTADDGPVKSCLKFSEEHAQKCDEMFTMDEDSNFNSNDLHQDAQDRFDAMGFDHNDEAFAPQKVVRQVVLYNGRWTDGEKYNELIETELEKLESDRQTWKLVDFLCSCFAAS